MISLADSYRVAYCIVPRIGGTFAFYKKLSVALKEKGVRVFAVSIGENESLRWDSAFADAGCVAISSSEKDPFRAAQGFSSWCEKEGINIVIPMCSTIGSSTVPHLSSGIRVVKRCSSITRHAYDLVTSNLEFCDRIVATSKRQLDDLATKRKVPQKKLTLIPHGVDAVLADRVYQQPLNQPIRLGYVGRLSHSDKGCLHLSRVAAILKSRNIPFHMTIIGDGEDRAQLERQLRAVGMNGSVCFRGAIPQDRVAASLLELDILLLPSHYEGFPNSLIEAMAAGVVPVAFRIAGVTDWIIEDGSSGFVCDAYRPALLTERIIQLHENRLQLTTMARNAVDRVRGRFNVTQMGSQYDSVFRSLLESSPAVRPRRTWQDFRLDSSHNPTWRRYVPQKCKDWARRRGIIA
jgi:glycosyltransferase involved in cell wall biosynthesis